MDAFVLPPPRPALARRKIGRETGAARHWARRKKTIASRVPAASVWTSALIYREISRQFDCNTVAGARAHAALHKERAIRASRRPSLRQPQPFRIWA